MVSLKRCCIPLCYLYSDIKYLIYLAKEIMHIFSSVFSEMVEFSKIFGKIFWEEQHSVQNTLSFGSRGSWQCMKYIALCIWALVKAPFTLGGLCVTHLNETELRKDLLFYHYVFGVRGGIVERRREEGREREKVRGTDILNTNFTIIHSMKKSFLTGNSLFQLPWHMAM